MTDADTETGIPTTILERLLAAGISEERARAYLDTGEVRVDGEFVTDPATPAPWGASRYTINPA